MKNQDICILRVFKNEILCRITRVREERVESDLLRFDSSGFDDVGIENVVNSTINKIQERSPVALIRVFRDMAWE